MEHFIYNAYFYTRINIYGLLGFRVHSLYMSLHSGMNHGHCHIIAKNFRKRNSLPIVLFFRFGCQPSPSLAHSPTLSLARSLTHSLACSFAPFLSALSFMLSYFNVWPHGSKKNNNITPHPKRMVIKCQPTCSFSFSASNFSFFLLKESLS